MRLRKLTTLGLTFGILLLAFTVQDRWPGRAATPTETQVAENVTAPTEETDEILYTPDEGEVRAEYQRDVANQKVQTWGEYWSWVQAFYKGNFMADGWTKYSQSTLDVVKAESARPTLLKKINRLGKIIGQEWAKHESVRKITTTDLRRWNDAITEARRSDDGTGKGIQNAVDKILELAEKRLAS